MGSKPGHERFKILIFLLLLTIGIWVWRLRLSGQLTVFTLERPSIELPEPKVFVNHTSEAIVNPVAKENHLAIGPSASEGQIHVNVHSWEEYNFKGKNEILTLRRDRVSETLSLVDGDYSPSEYVFGRIVDGKPWWGLDGSIIYGSGPHSIDGPSCQSIFLGNPFLLIGLSLDLVYGTPSDRYAHPAEEVMPKPEEIIFEPRDLMATVRYRISPYREYLDWVHPNDLRHNVFLNTYNAQDFGFHFLTFDLVQSSNIHPQSMPDQPVQLIQFIHCGGSCGYDGGCNNQSPGQPELTVDVQGIPAKAVLKLWRTQPSQAGGSADMTYIIDME
jgi:hypothetical protein